MILKDEMLLLIKKYNIKLTEVEKRNSELWHSLLAPFVAKEKFKIDDEEILSSLRYHTTGKENMTKLEKIIYISDMIEPSRSFEGLSEIRDKTFENLDKGVFLGLSRSIEYILNKNQLIDENTIKARNYFLYDENFL
ncbi:bis(5'-nucleosyl)-tetraphosphatase (symmetrical) YqeK [Clostridium sp. BJN0001]|uniref:bis(5'-nucleosyl)-tetraphosphatase (symmetrical) YqeK n=1 Tax=Clostridium sp. BJN0001 TaxID=2930219 RepID=UPI001FD60AE0|nr:bis(5'-nucleosyl)-tetraphosphatase (symmetrical) YqeK [Clostridium sp. BJN0001]